MTVVDFKMKQAHWITRNTNDGSSLLAIWEPPIDRFFNAKLAVGSASDEDFASLSKNQKIFIPRLVKDKVPDVFGDSTGPFIISEKIKEYLEDHEPGVHQFSPIQICSEKPIHGKTDHGLHWLLRAPPLIDCLLIEGTIFKHDIQGIPWPHKKTDTNYWGGGLPGNDYPCFFERGLIEGHHLWRFAVGSTHTKYACSDKFWNFFKANKMLGWQSENSCQLR